MNRSSGLGLVHVTHFCNSEKHASYAMKLVAVNKSRDQSHLVTARHMMNNLCSQLWSIVSECRGRCVRNRVRVVWSCRFRRVWNSGCFYEIVIILLVINIRTKVHVFESRGKGLARTRREWSSSSTGIPTMMAKLEDGYERPCSYNEYITSHVMRQN